MEITAKICYCAMLTMRLRDKIELTVRLTVNRVFMSSIFVHEKLTIIMIADFSSSHIASHRIDDSHLKWILFEWRKWVSVNRDSILWAIKTICALFILEYVLCGRAYPYWNSCDWQLFEKFSQPKCVCVDWKSICQMKTKLKKTNRLIGHLNGIHSNHIPGHCEWSQSDT